MPAPASATIVELGATTTPLAVPTCPAGASKSQCTIILTEATALETASDRVLYPTTVTRPGRIVAYTVGMARLAKPDIVALNAAYGGPSRLAITVLRRGKRRFFTVEYESPILHVEPWFGHVVQFPLATSLPVKKGDVIALTTPTWAPVLSINLPAKPFQYRASRSSRCASQGTFSTQNAQLTTGDTKQYLCYYTATRVQYTATEITNPPVPKDAIH